MTDAPRIEMGPPVAAAVAVRWESTALVSGRHMQMARRKQTTAQALRRIVVAA